MGRSTERVRAFFADRGIEIEIRELSASTRTAELAAAAVGSELGEIIKSLLFIVEEASSVRAVLALVAGDRRADPARIAAALHATSARIANADEVRAHTGFAIGGVAPVAHVPPKLGVAGPSALLVDRSLLRFARVWAAAGAPNAVFQIELETLLDLTQGTLADITES